MAVPKKNIAVTARHAGRPTRSCSHPHLRRISGELRRPHHIDLKSGMYRGRQVLKKKTEA